MNVGLCWAGSKDHRNDAMRSIPRSALLPLSTVPHVSWWALAKDAYTDQLAAAGLPNGLDGCTDWLDTAERITGQHPGFPALDLVITVDTAIAHLAGGLGIPVWICLAAVPDFRWGLKTFTTPWYRSARLYRQTIAGEWGPVLDRIAFDLTDLSTHRYRTAA